MKKLALLFCSVALVFSFATPAEAKVRAKAYPRTHAMAVAVPQHSIGTAISSPGKHRTIVVCPRPIPGRQVCWTY